jgi:hypothetical protein
MLSFRFIRLAGITIALLVGAGCHGRPEPRAAVHGRITYKGDPLCAGVIVFVPDTSRGFRGPLAHAEIHADGRYALQTGDAAGAGAGAGWYRVTVAAVAAPPALLDGHRYPIPLSLLPERYRSVDLSGLTCEVKAEQDNTIDFNLE